MTRKRAPAEKATSAAVVAATAAQDATANDAAAVPANGAMVSGERGAPRVLRAIHGLPATTIVAVSGAPIGMKAKAAPRGPASRRRRAQSQATKNCRSQAASARRAAEAIVANDASVDRKALP